MYIHAITENKSVRHLQPHKISFDRFGFTIQFIGEYRTVKPGRPQLHHPLFDWRNPNRFRSVLGAMSGNHAGFHHASGKGYALLADWLIKLDPLNPQTAARMSTAFETWRRYDPARQSLIRAALQRVAATQGLSRDLGEMVGRMLAA